MMRIAIDARELVGAPTGVGRYLMEILKGWSGLAGAGAHEFILCAPTRIDLPGTLRLEVSTAIARGSGTLWEQTQLPRLIRRVRPDVLFAPAYSGPVLCPVPMVVTIHDVSFAAHPDWFSWREGARRRVLTRLSARRAARVLTVSDFSKREISSHLGIDQTKIEVVYPGATSLTDTPPSSRADGPGTLVLYVGSIFNRRHVPELIAGFAQLAGRRSDVRLEIVGDNRSRPALDLDGLVRASGAQDRIRVRPYVTDGDLADLYARASAFAFLSDYEGFGMTPLEALSAGVPIVVLDTQVSREIYGPAARYVPRPEPALIAAGLEHVVFDEAERARIRGVAASMLERYSWRDCAHRTLQVLSSSTAG